MNNISNNSVSNDTIELIKKHLKLQKMYELPENDTDISHLYYLTDTDYELGGYVVSKGLINSGYKPISNENFNDRIKLFFETSPDCSLTQKKQHASFYTFFINNTKEKYIEKTEDDYTYDHIFVFPKYKIISAVPLLDGSVSVENNKLNFDYDQNTISRNKYLFNDSKADLVWLIANDKDFLKNLLIVFGYDKEEKINEFVLKDLYKQYSEETPDSLQKIGNLFFVKDCRGKLNIRKNLLKYVEKNTNENDDRYIVVLSTYMLGLYSSESLFSDIEKAEIVANISNIEIQGREKYKFGNSNSSSWSSRVSGLFYLQSKNAINDPEILEILKKHNYFGFDFLKKYIESDELQNEMPNNIDGGEGFLDIEKEQKKKDKKLHLYDRPDFSSYSKDTLVKEDIEVVHQNSGWSFVKINGMTGYLPTDEKRQELEEKNKFSFLADEKDIKPENKKGFWDNLFG